MGRAAQRLSEAAAVCLVYNNCPDVVSAAGVGLLQKQAMRWWPPSHRDVHSKHLFVFLKRVRRTERKHKVAQCSAVGLPVLTEGLIAGVTVSQSGRCESLWRFRALL